MPQTVIIKKDDIKDYINLKTTAVQLAIKYSVTDGTINKALRRQNVGVICTKTLRLSDKHLALIANDEINQTQLAARLGVSKTAVGNAIRRQTNAN
jgi:Arc/MetJ family transcription regulator